MSIPTYRDLNIEQVNYTSPTLVNKRHIAVARNEDKSEVLFDTPVLEVKNGFCVSEDRCYLELILKRRDSKFYNFLVDIGDSGITTTFKQSRNWFGNEMPFDIVDDYHRSVVKLSRDKGVATIKCKVPYNSKKDRIRVKIYNKAGAQLEQSDLQDGTFVVARLRYNGLRFLKQMFTEEYEVVRLTVQEGTTDESLDDKYGRGGYDFGFEQYDNMTVDENNDDLLKEYESDLEADPKADPVEVEAEDDVNQDDAEDESEADDNVNQEGDDVEDDHSEVEDINQEADDDVNQDGDDVEDDHSEVEANYDENQEGEGLNQNDIEEVEVNENQEGEDKGETREEIEEIESEMERVLEEERKERKERQRRRRRRKEKKSKSVKGHKRVLMLSGGRTREL